MKTLGFMVAGILLLGLGSPAIGQVVTIQRLPTSRASAGAASLDTADTLDIELLKIGGWADLMGPTLRRAMQDTLEAQRRIWARQRPREYLIRSIELSDCFVIVAGPVRSRALLRDQFHVRDTTIVARIPVPIPASYEGRCAPEKRVEDLFAEVATALADTNSNVRNVRYDAAYGFPRYYSITPSMGRGHTALVESFAPTQ